MHKTTGTWTVVISINGEPFITVPVEVVETVDLNFNRPPENISGNISASPIGSSALTPEDVLTCRLTIAQNLIKNRSLLEYRTKPYQD